MAEKAKKKKGFKMPHLLWLMLGMLIVASLATYIIPAGTYGTTADGAIDGNAFAYLDAQTPVNPIDALLQIFPGMTGNANVIFAVLIGGGGVQIFLATKTFDKVLDWLIYKMQGKKSTIIVIVMFCAMVYLGGFGGSDALVAMVPIGIVFATKLHLDPACAMGVTTFATLTGFACSPKGLFQVQGMMNTIPYGGFVTRFVLMNIFMVIGCVMLVQYVNKITSDPTKSISYEDGWRPGTQIGAQPVDASVAEKAATSLTWQNIVSLLLFVGQYVFVVVYNLKVGKINTYYLQATVFTVVGAAIGLINGMSFDTVGKTYEKGVQGMAFVGFVIGMANAVSLVLKAGNVLHTIVHFITQPLMNAPKWISSVGMYLVIALVNIIIPSKSSKAALLIPILKPIGEVLHLEGELLCQAYQFGDGFTNLISPVLGWTVGSVTACGLEMNKWYKWAVPKVLVYVVFGAIFMYILTAMNWSFAI